MTTPQFAFSGWTWNPAVLVSGAAALALYLAAFRDHRRIGWFAAALAVFLLTLLSPLNTLADGYLFSAHMAQHILLLLIVPALLLLSLPRSLSLAVRPRVLGHPLAGWVAGVGAMWFWHAPTLCNAAVSSRPVHALQTVSLILLGGVFWRLILAPREDERLSPPAAVLYLFSACVACSLLGIIITFSPVAVCSIYAAPPIGSPGILHTIRSGWGITPERDQQIGGLLMWVPMCLIYLIAILAQIARWFAEPAGPAHIGKNMMNREPLAPTTPGWDPLPPGHLPRPTYFPAGLAMGTAFIFWGLITSLDHLSRRDRPFYRRPGRLDLRNSP